MRCFKDIITPTYLSAKKDIFVSDVKSFLGMAAQFCVSLLLKHMQVCRQSELTDCSAVRDGFKRQLVKGAHVGNVCGHTNTQVSSPL